MLDGRKGVQEGRLYKRILPFGCIENAVRINTVPDTKIPCHQPGKRFTKYSLNTVLPEKGKKELTTPTEIESLSSFC